MKIRVAYTYEIGDEDLKALRRYHHPEVVGRDEIRQLLIDEGQGGLEEQISQGQTWAEQEDLEGIEAKTLLRCGHYVSEECSCRELMPEAFVERGKS